MFGALAGIRVVEVAQYVFVPVAAGVLAEWGADVIKVEHPRTGDAYRGLRSTGALAVAGARAARRAGKKSAKKYDIYIYFKITFQPARSTSHVTAARPESSCTLRGSLSRLVNRRRRARLRAASSRPRSRVLPCGGGGSLGLGLGWRRGELVVDVVSAALQREEEGRGQVWRAKGVVATGSPYHGYAC